MFIQSVPDFLRSKTPEGLRRAMLQNNVKRGFWFKYEIKHDGKEWFAWYLKEQNAFEALQEELKK